MKGLRREEVALLADIGVTWYTWLEQGRDIPVAPKTLTRIATALQLNASETEYLQRLVQSPSDVPHIWEIEVPESVRYVVEHFGEGIAFVRNRRLDFLAWNDTFGRFQRIDRGAPALERNALWKVFTDKDRDSVYVDWQTHARSVVAAFRAEYADFIGDRDFEDLIERVSSVSAEFSALWSDFDVLSTTRWTHRVVPLRDPDTGAIVPLRFDSLALTKREHHGLIVVFGIFA